MNIQTHLKENSDKIDKALESFLPKNTGHSTSLGEAMRYAVMSGGKRIRPVLVLESCRAVRGDIKKVMPAACAIELIHSYSLVHDDLPSMDNDLLRRGQATCHVKFGEGTALLVGDALLTQAFEILTEPNKYLKPSDLKKQLEAARFIAQSSGIHGMVGGQALDVEFQDKSADLATLEFINIRKTGALIAASTWAGAYLGGGTPKQVKAVHQYGKTIGFLFQIVDDILDAEGYAKLLGQDQAKAQAQSLLDKAKRSLDFLGADGHILKALADFIMERKH